MSRGYMKPAEFGIYAKLTGEALKQALIKDPGSDGFSTCPEMYIQCKTQRTADNCIGEYIRIGRLASGEYKAVRLA